jgi:hypothetical protein
MVRAGQADGSESRGGHERLPLAHAEYEQQRDEQRAQHPRLNHSE